MAQPLEYEQVTYNGPDGGQMGRTSSDLISFYGATPAARGSNPTPASASTYTTTTNTTAVFGFGDISSVTSLIYQVSTLSVCLRNLGLIA